MLIFPRRGFGFTSVAMWRKAGAGAVALSLGGCAGRGGNGAGSRDLALLADGRREEAGKCSDS